MEGYKLYERKAVGKLILKHICMKTVKSYITKRHDALKCFFEGDRGGRVDNCDTQGVQLYFNKSYMYKSNIRMWLSCLHIKSTVM